MFKGIYTSEIMLVVKAYNLVVCNAEGEAYKNLPEIALKNLNNSDWQWLGDFAVFLDFLK